MSRTGRIDIGWWDRLIRKREQKGRQRLAKGERGRNSQTTSGPGTSKVRVLEGNGARWKNCLDVKTWESLLRRPHSIKRPRPKRYAIHRAAYVCRGSTRANTRENGVYRAKNIHDHTESRVHSASFCNMVEETRARGRKGHMRSQAGGGKKAVATTSSRVVSYRNLLPATNPSHLLHPRGTGSIDQ